MTTVLAVVSDLHTNSTIGLCPPRVHRDDGGEYRPSPAQRWLWRNWLHYCARVQTVAEQHDAKVVTVFNGDIYDGDHHNTTQIITRNEATMDRIAWDVCKKLVDISERVYVMRGTESHVGAAAKHEEGFANDLTNIVRSETAASWYWLQMELEGVRFDIAHHGEGLGKRSWTKLNALGRMATGTVMDYVTGGMKVPHVLLRAHFHQFLPSGRVYPVEVVAMPAWQLATAHVLKSIPNASMLATVGGLIFVCNDGEYTMEPVLYRAAKKPYHKVTL